MPTDPTAITAAQLIAALESWDIDTHDVQDVRLVANAKNGGYIELRRLRRDADGRTFLAGGQPATVTTMVAVQPVRSIVGAELRDREAIDR